MKQSSDSILNFNGANPFSDIQSRSYSDKKVAGEFYPTSCFWSLFNDQHEVLVGKRGSGKTFLLKMMRQSMLKTVLSANAEEIVRKKEYCAFYVPMQLEIVSQFGAVDYDCDRQRQVFCFFFNSILAEAILDEIIKQNESMPETESSIQSEIDVSRSIFISWFGNSPQIKSIHSYADIIDIVRDQYYGFDLRNGDLSAIPASFTRSICNTLILAKRHIRKALSLHIDPTYIVCVDEAEFLNQNILKCINNFFRSNSEGIVLKVATLPFYYSTYETLTNISANPGHDFTFRIVDINYESDDFINLTNKLCASRIMNHAPQLGISFTKLEEFVGRVGKDDRIDYYRAEVGEEKATREYIEEQIINEFSRTRKQNSERYSYRRKTIYDKFAPVFYVREMRKISKKGNSIPGWYAGADIIRKVSDGNPRTFLQIMNALFETARKTRLTPKAQHQVIVKYAAEFCDSTQAIEGYGPISYDVLNQIGCYLQIKVHDGPLVANGNSFKLKLDYHDKELVESLKQAIAFSRVSVPVDVIKYGLNSNTEYVLSNLYAVHYWVPMRKDQIRIIPIKKKIDNSYVIDMTDLNDSVHLQLPLFEGEPL